MLEGMLRFTGSCIEGKDNVLIFRIVIIIIRLG